MSLTSLFTSNPPLDWLLALGLATSSFLALLLARRVSVRRLTALAERGTAPWDRLYADTLRRTSVPVLAIASLRIGAELLELPSLLSHRLTTLVVLAFTYQAGRWAAIAAKALFQRYLTDRLAGDRSAATTIGALGFLAQMLIWSTVVLVALDEVGVNITALAAGFGIGGVAIALATQKILGDLFASLAIVLDKPFVIGDSIGVAEFSGTVEHIGLKTTRLRSVSGEQLVFSNADLLGSRIRNFGRMAERRVAFRTRVAYDTPREKLERIPALLRAAVEAQRDVRFDRSHWAAYGDYGLEFETVYWVTTPEYGRFMEIQQGVNLEVHESFERAAIAFGYLPSATAAPR